MELTSRDEGNLQVNILDELEASINQEATDWERKRQEEHELKDARRQVGSQIMRIARERIKPGCGGKFRYDKLRDKTSFRVDFDSGVHQLTIKLNNLVEDEKGLVGGGGKRRVRLDSQKLASNDVDTNILRIQRGLNKEDALEPKKSEALSFWGLTCIIVDKQKGIEVVLPDIDISNAQERGEVRRANLETVIRRPMIELPMVQRAALYREVSQLISSFLQPQDEATVMKL